MNINTDCDQPDDDDVLAMEQVFASWADERIDASPRLWTAPEILFRDFCDWLEQQDSDDELPTLEQFHNLVVENLPTRSFGGAVSANVGIRDEEQRPRRHARRVR